MSIYMSYILLGLSLAAPIGPINAAQLDKGIKNGFFHAWMVGVGAMIADAIYMALVYLGIVHFLDSAFLKSFLWFFGSFVLLYTGFESILSAGKLFTKDQRSDEPAIKSFTSGFIMSLTNPLTILFWLGIYGSVLAKAAATFEMNQFLLYSCAIFLGVALWDFSMAAAASTFRKVLTPKLLVFISRISGLSLIGFGIYFGLQAFQSL